MKTDVEQVAFLLFGIDIWKCQLCPLTKWLHASGRILCFIHLQQFSRETRLECSSFPADLDSVLFSRDFLIPLPLPSEMLPHSGTSNNELILPYPSVCKNKFIVGRHLRLRFYSSRAYFGVGCGILQTGKLSTSCTFWVQNLMQHVNKDMQALLECM